MARAERSSGKTRFLARALGVDILQKIVEVWLTGEAFLRSGDLGVQD
jgi:hypothetical protein